MVIKLVTIKINRMLKNREVIDSKNTTIVEEIFVSNSRKHL